MQRLKVIICAIVATVGIAGCGSETDSGDASAPPASEESASSPTEEAASPSPSEPAEFDPATAALTDKSFCDDIEVAAAEGFLGLGNGQLDLVTSRTVGEKFQDAVGETTKSESNSCYYADAKETAFLFVGVTPNSSVSDVQGLLDLKAEFDGGPGESDDCKVEKDPSFGDPGGVAICEGVNFDSVEGRAAVDVIGLVGGSKFYCQGGIAQGAQPQDLDGPTRDFCSKVLEELADDS